MWKQLMRQRMTTRALAVLGMAGGLLAIRPAHADLRFTNHYRTPVYVAVAQYAGDIWRSDIGRAAQWQSRGWYRVNSGQTITVYRGSVSKLNRYWYAYVEAEDGRAIWSGNYLFRVNDPEAFNYVLPGRDHLDSRWQRKGFFAMDVRDNDHYTMRLTP